LPGLGGQRGGVQHAARGFGQLRGACQDSVAHAVWQRQFAVVLRGFVVGGLPLAVFAALQPAAAHAMPQHFADEKWVPTRCALQPRRKTPASTRSARVMTL